MNTVCASPAICGNGPASAGPTPLSATLRASRSDVGPPTMPSAVVSTVTSASPPASDSARSRAAAHRVRPSGRSASIDSDESSTTVSGPPALPAAWRSGRPSASTTSSGTSTATAYDTALRTRSQNETCRSSSSTRRHSNSDGTSTRGCRTFMKKSAVTAAATPAASAATTQPASAPNVMRGTCPAGRPAGSCLRTAPRSAYVRSRCRICCSRPRAPRCAASRRGDRR